VRNTAEDDILGAQDQLVLTSRYRQFLFSSFGRVVFTRLMSLVYMILVSRFVAQNIQDVMILLATGQWIVGIIATFGFTYALMIKTIKDDNKIEVLYSGTSSVLMVGIPITVFLNSSLASYSSLQIRDSFLFVFSCLLNLFLLVAYIVEEARLRSDRREISASLYSVFTSLLVPTLFLVLPSLTSVLLAWISSMLITLLYERKILFSIITNFTINLTVSWEIFRLGLPVYAVQIFSALVQRVDTLILYSLFPEGELSMYYWAWRLGTTIQEVFFVLLTGSLPLLTKLYKTSDVITYEKRIGSMIRMVILASLFLYGGVLIEANILILVILSEEFTGSFVIFQILIVAFSIRAISPLLNHVHLAMSKRRYHVEVTLTENLFRIVLLFVLSQFGGFGMALVTLFQYCYVTVYFIVRSRKYFVPAVINPRFIGTLLGVISIIVLLPTSSDLLIALISGFIFVIASVLLLLLFRPLTSDDKSMIERLLGTRYSFISRVIGLIAKS